MIIIGIIVLFGSVWLWMGNKSNEKDNNIYWANCTDVFVVSSRHRNDTSVSAVADSIRQKLADCGNKNECPVIELPYGIVQGGKSTIGMTFPQYRRWVCEQEVAHLEAYSRKITSLDKDFANRKIANQKPFNEVEW